MTFELVEEEDTLAELKPYYFDDELSTTDECNTQNDSETENLCQTTDEYIVSYNQMPDGDDDDVMEYETVSIFKNRFRN